jgi:hypothetical protein
MMKTAGESVVLRFELDDAGITERELRLQVLYAGIATHEKNCVADAA